MAPIKAAVSSRHLSDSQKGTNEGINETALACHPLHNGRLMLSNRGQLLSERKTIMLIAILLLILLIILALPAMRPGFESREGDNSRQYYKRIYRYSAPHH